jgi:regulator of sigma E protease
LQFSQTLLDGGLRNGDNILKIDGKPVDRTSDAIKKILIEGDRQITVLRNGENAEVLLPENTSQSILANEETDLINIRYPFVIAQVADGTPASTAGLQPGDSIVAINGQTLSIYQDIVKALEVNKNASILLSYIRNGEWREAGINLTETGKLGVGVLHPFALLQTKRLEYSFFQSIPAGVSLGWETLSDYVKQFKLVFSKEGAKQLGGFAAIGKLFAPVWNWYSFWMMTALLSIILAFMNFLPIPALDGGHFLFLLYEMITRRKPSEKFLEYSQMLGFMLLLALLVFANGNDIYKAIFK